MSRYQYLKCVARVSLRSAAVFPATNQNTMRASLAFYLQSGHWITNPPYVEHEWEWVGGKGEWVRDPTTRCPTHKQPDSARQ